MSIKKKAAPKITHHRPTGQARVRLTDTTTGKRKDVYLGAWGSAEAHRRYAEVIERWQAEGHVVDGQGRRKQGTQTGTAGNATTVSELCLSYWEAQRTRYGVSDEGRLPTHLYTVRSVLRKLRGIAGAMAAEDFGPRALQDVRKTLIESGWTRETINKHTQTIIRVFRHGVAEELIGPDVPQALACVENLKRGQAPEGQKVRPVPDADIAAIEHHVAGVVWDMIRVQLCTGMRPAEVCGMMGTDVDTAGDIWLYRPTHHKTSHHGHERVVHIGPRAQEIIRPRLNTGHVFDPHDAVVERMEQQKAGRTTPATYGNRPQAGTPTPSHRVRDHYDTQSYGRAIRRACEKAGVEPWGPNRLRHNHATELRRRYGAEVVGLMLGHSGTNLIDVYAEKDSAKALKIASEVG